MGMIEASGKHKEIKFYVNITTVCMGHDGTGHLPLFLLFGGLPFVLRPAGLDAPDTPGLPSCDDTYHACRRSSRILLCVRQ